MAGRDIEALSRIMSKVVYKRRFTRDWRVRAIAGPGHEMGFKFSFPHRI